MCIVTATHQQQPLGKWPTSYDCNPPKTHVSTEREHTHTYISISMYRQRASPSVRAHIKHTNTHTHPPDHRRARQLTLLSDVPPFPNSPHALSLPYQPSSSAASIATARTDDNSSPPLVGATHSQMPHPNHPRRSIYLRVYIYTTYSALWGYGRFPTNWRCGVGLCCVCLCICAYRFLASPHIAGGQHDEMCRAHSSPCLFVFVGVVVVAIFYNGPRCPCKDTLGLGLVFVCACVGPFTYAHTHSVRADTYVMSSAGFKGDDMVGVGGWRGFSGGWCARWVCTAHDHLAGQMEWRLVAGRQSIKGHVRCICSGIIYVAQQTLWLYIYSPQYITCTRRIWYILNWDIPVTITLLEVLRFLN